MDATRPTPTYAHRMVFYGLATYAERAEVVAWYPTREQATDALRDVLTDEPDWRGRMSVLKVDFARETARRVLV